MANSALLLDNGVDLLSEDIELSLHSLQSLLEDLKDDSEEKTKKSKKPDKKIYDEDGIKSFFYSDDEDDEDDEEEYPTPDREDQEKLREAARKIGSKHEHKENEEQSAIEKINYERVNAAQRIKSTVYQNNVNYPTDRALHSVVIENNANTDVYKSLLNVAISHNLQIEAKTYEGWGGGGIYVESINGIKNGQNGYFWEYIVNGKIPDVSVDKFQLHSGDLIEWRLLKKQNSGCGV